MIGVVDGGPVLAGTLDVLGRVVLHGPAHAAEESGGVGVEYVVAGMAFLGLAGGLLFWYYERRAGSA